MKGLVHYRGIRDEALKKETYKNTHMDSVKIRAHLRIVHPFPYLTQKSVIISFSLFLRLRINPWKRVERC